MEDSGSARARVGLWRRKKERLAISLALHCSRDSGTSEGIICSTRFWNSRGSVRAGLSVSRMELTASALRSSISCTAATSCAQHLAHTVTVQAREDTFMSRSLPRQLWCRRRPQQAQQKSGWAALAWMGLPQAAQTVERQ